MPDLHNTLYRLVPTNAWAISNQNPKEQFLSTVRCAHEADFDKTRDALIEQGRPAKEQRRDGSVQGTERHNGNAGFALQAQEKLTRLLMLRPDRDPATPSHRATHG